MIISFVNVYLKFPVGQTLCYSANIMEQPKTFPLYPYGLKLGTSVINILDKDKMLVNIQYTYGEPVSEWILGDLLLCVSDTTINRTKATVGLTF